MNPIILILDTETNGLKGNEGKSAPDLIQLSWKLIDKNWDVVQEKNYYIKPYGFNILPEIEKIIGVSNEFVLENGVDLRRAIKEFKKDLLISNYIVAHNIEFDLKVLQKASYLGDGFKAINIDRKICVCTMLETISFCNIIDLTGIRKLKYPTLSELYKKLFKIDFDGAHNSYYDVSATCKCFIELVKKGVLCQELLEGKSLWNICDENKFEYYPQKYEPKNKV